jgi:hypothetical protein
MSIVEIVIGTGIATGAVMVAVTPWPELLLMIWGATADSVNTGGTYIRNKLEESSPVGYGISKFLGFLPGFALIRLAVNQDARDQLHACSNIKVDSAGSFFDRLGCGAKGFFWGK